MQVIEVDREHGRFASHIHAVGCSHRTMPAYAYDQSSWSIPIEIDDPFSVYAAKVFDCIPRPVPSEDYSPMAEDTDIEIAPKISYEPADPTFEALVDEITTTVLPENRIYLVEDDDDSPDFDDLEKVKSHAYANVNSDDSFVFIAARHAGDAYLDFELVVEGVDSSHNDEVSVILMKAVNEAAKAISNL